MSTIDGMLETAFRKKKPCYLEIPYDLQTAEVDAPDAPLYLGRPSATPRLQDAVASVAKLIEQAKPGV